MRRRLAARAPVTIAVLVAAAVAAVAWFEPHKLFIDQTVDEAPPPAEATTSPTHAVVSPSPGARVGRFRALAHRASGNARIVRSETGAVVRFERFRVENGPDLWVALSPVESSASEDRFERGLRLVAPLKGNVGSQNYTIPASFDLRRYRSVVIWCRRFNVSFAVAPLR